VRKLLRDGIAFGFDKVLRDHHLYSTTSTDEEDTLLLALRALVDLAALLLELRAAALAPAGAQAAELDSELLQVVNLLGALFARDTPLHEYHAGSEAPAYDDEPQTYVWAAPIAAAPAAADGEGSGGDGGGEEVAHEWLVHLINRFGGARGFHQIYNVRARGAAAGRGGARSEGKGAVGCATASLPGAASARPQQAARLLTGASVPTSTPAPQLLNSFPHQGDLSIYMVAALMHVLANTAEQMPDAALFHFKQVRGSWLGGRAGGCKGLAAGGRQGMAAAHTYPARRALTPMPRAPRQAVSALLRRLVPLAASDDDLLSDQGQDRTYQTLRNLLIAAGEVLAAHGSEAAADEDLAPLQQAFVVRMMESSNFTKQLSGVRELRHAVHRVAELPDSEAREDRIQVGGGRGVGGGLGSWETRAWQRGRQARPLEECGTAALRGFLWPRSLSPALAASQPRPARQVLVEWMEEHRLVERMLRANLHQRQYMQQVRSCPARGSRRSRVLCHGAGATCGRSLCFPLAAAADRRLASPRPASPAAGQRHPAGPRQHRRPHDGTPGPVVGRHRARGHLRGRQGPRVRGPRGAGGRVQRRAGAATPQGRGRLRQTWENALLPGA
jgi:hypothetical protein